MKRRVEERSTEARFTHPLDRGPRYDCPGCGAPTETQVDACDACRQRWPVYREPTTEKRKKR